ncbi:putative RNA polymerase sigma factor FecI [compost metagenome]
MLSRLPAVTREIFLLAQLEGLTLAEIVTRTGKPLITVRRHLHKALSACMAVAA